MSEERMGDQLHVEGLGTGTKANYANFMKNYVVLFS
jgi:hypothetical protein